MINTGPATTLSGTSGSGREPFSDPPIGRPTAHYVPIEGHEEALARLLYLGERGHSGAIMVGPQGVGKSLLLEEASRELRNGQRCVLHIDIAGLDEESVCERFFYAAGLARPFGETPVKSERRLRDYFQGQQLVGHPIVILVDHVDEADDGGLRALHKIVRLADRRVGTLTVLAAAADLQRALEIGWLAQMSELRIDVPPLTRDDVSEYLAASLLLAECPHSFSASAIDRIAEESGGLPRMINRLGRLAVLAANATDLREISVDLLESVMHELPVTRPALSMSAAV